MMISWLHVFSIVLTAVLVACGDAGSPPRDEAARVALSSSRERPAQAEEESRPARPGAAGGVLGTASPPAAPTPERDFSGNMSKVEVSSAGGPPQIRSGTTDTASAPSMLIRTGTAQLEVDSLEIAMQQVRDLAQRLGGIIANTQLASGRDQIRSATLEMKIPAARWTDALTGLAPIGKVEALNEHTEDVGEEYVDVTARVRNARRLESRLIELLGNRTGRLSDVLAVERELARVREEIERYEGRLRYLLNRVQMSTLTVTVHEAYPVVSARGETGVLGDAFKQAWRNFVGFIAGIISLTGILIPLAVLGVVAWLVWRRWRPRRPPPVREA
ncbi:MAG: DUF4349 domain-containing protein [Gemmatimonadaceae bacterium]